MKTDISEISRILKASEDILAASPGARFTYPACLARAAYNLLSEYYDVNLHDRYLFSTSVDGESVHIHRVTFNESDRAHLVERLTAALLPVDELIGEKAAIMAAVIAEALQGVHGGNFTESFAIRLQSLKQNET